MGAVNQTKILNDPAEIARLCFERAESARERFMANACEKGEITGGTSPVVWQKPISLNRSPLPTATADDFPDILWKITDAVSKFLEVPPELPGLIALAVSAVCCQKKFEVSPDPGYSEPLNIWCLPALESGNRKSAAARIITEPLNKWEVEQARLLSPRIKEATITRNNQEARLKALQQKYSKAKDSLTAEETQSEMVELSMSLEEIPASPQLWGQDVTPEKLGMLMADNGEKMAIISSEGGIFDIIAGRYSSGMPNLDVFLQGHAGDSVRVDRGGRESIWLHKPALTLSVSPQPAVISALAEKQGFRGRGLIARFLYALPNSLLGSRTLDTKPVPEEITVQYKKVLFALLDYPCGEEAITIFFDTEAHRLWKKFAHEVEKDLADGGRLQHMRDWGGKLPGAAARIAGIFHCVSHAEGDPGKHKVVSETMARALGLARKLTLHAISVHDLMGADPEIEGARKVLAWMKKRGKPDFSIRDCHHDLQHVFKKRKELGPAIEILKERGYIRPLPFERTSNGGRSSERYAINPQVFE